MRFYIPRPSNETKTLGVQVWSRLFGYVMSKGGRMYF